MKTFQLLLAFIILGALGCDKSPSPQTKKPAPRRVVTPTPGIPEYLGSDACESCHATEVKKWRGSHHDLAMQVASAETVLGNFGGVEFAYFREKARFSTHEGKYFIDVEYPDGTQATYEIQKTFGVYPLQQYLVKARGGRLQASSYVWDTRTKAEGGQRWFHLYADEYVGLKDPLHWTGLLHNWNTNCADCHSTGIEKGYDFQSDTYTTTSKLEDVGCENCHGPASFHVRAANAKNTAQARADIRSRKQLSNRAWTRSPEQRIAALDGDTIGVEDSCSTCHARRVDFGIGAKKLGERYRLQMLDDRLYFADGQIKDEVFVYGSFAQSRMYQAGVTCIDCHDPHTLELKADGDALCHSCHAPAVFGPKHSMHEVGKVSCVDCHMPQTTYMGVDERADHRFGVPRPIEEAALGAPSPCLGCHSGESPKWAADVIQAAKLTPAKGAAFGKLFHSMRLGDPKAVVDLAKLVSDGAQPSIVRGTAATLLPPSPEQFERFKNVLKEDKTLLNVGIMQAALSYPLAEQTVLGVAGIHSKELSVRMSAVSAFLEQGRRPLSKPEDRRALKSALKEFRESHLANIDRPESLLAMATFETTVNNDPQAGIVFLQAAISRFAWYTEAYVNLAEMQRSIGKTDLEMETLLAGLESAADKPAIHFALGLAFVRQKDTTKALKHLREAFNGTPSNERYGYVLAVALIEYETPIVAKSLLSELLIQFPDNARFLQLQKEVDAK